MKTIIFLVCLFFIGVCLAEEEAVAVVCSGNQRACGAYSCYDPTSQQCYAGGLVCGFFQRACGNRCYDPQSQQCYPGGLVCGFFQRATV
ncbi:hypothetical protein PPL_04718 [Heterostelium album PN500]|uniref:Uncharacterized protein n=1 Tax=Heterostelium pallidum (strain ATCC 26659 / Pp 5 / PN500) TaxID=670386 RepID=D3B8C6_HETP5|nr:hypothetical protein PPL_04718 [Heterostelium album PN500]EFA82294.1 hypothetical protein PPL_04718 [Heterostelium album PN500]|eukprot:XP_020434411.1 hypothetical protein PPL_04718 [Heterostelium album PN500]